MSDEMTVVADAGAIRKALAELPARCRYHGDDFDQSHDKHSLRAREGACCDTGLASLRRKRAEAALVRLASR